MIRTPSLTRRDLLSRGAAAFGTAAAFSLTSHYAMANTPVLSEAILRQPPEASNPERLMDMGATNIRNAPMSVSKLLLAVGVMRALNIQGVSSQTVITFGNEATSPAVSEFHLNFRNGDQIQIQDCLAFTVLNSCNQSALQLAIDYFGSAAGAVRAMQSIAREYGMNDTRVVSPNGLPVIGADGKRDRGEMTAYDAALMGMKVHTECRNDPLYARLMQSGGFITSDTAYRLFKEKKRAFPKASNQGADGYMHLFASGDGLIPVDLPEREKCRVLKTGSYPGLSNAVLCDERGAVPIFSSVMGAANKDELRRCIGTMLRATAPLALTLRLPESLTAGSVNTPQPSYP